jgi:hypothetical protein
LERFVLLAESEGNKGQCEKAISRGCTALVLVSLKERIDFMQVLVCFGQQQVCVFISLLVLVTQHVLLPDATDFQVERFRFVRLVLMIEKLSHSKVTAAELNVFRSEFL